MHSMILVECAAMGKLESDRIAEALKVELEDVRVIFYSNTGNALVMRGGTARIENDPFSYGDIIAEYVLKLLDGRKAAPPRICWRFVPGASL